MKINDAIFGALFLLFGLVVVVHVQAFPKIPGQQVGPALFPGLVAAALAVGGVSINNVMATEANPALPFGGVKQSGIGREGGHHGLLEFCETKYVATGW